jgi:hypothetical protein
VLYPVDRDRVLQRITPNSIGSESTPQNVPPAVPGSSQDKDSQPRSSTENSPRKLLIKEITKVISPSASAEVEAAKKNQKQRRKRIQAQAGEVLTEEISAARLQAEEAAKTAKQSNKGKGVKGKPGLAKGKGVKGKPGLAKGIKNKSKDSKQKATTSGPAHQISTTTEEQSDDSEPEIPIGPRKPRRKLIVPAEDEGQATPSKDSKQKATTSSPENSNSMGTAQQSSTTTEEQSDDSELEILLHPRKRRRKLIVPAEDEGEVAPSNEKEGQVLKAIRKLLDVEDPAFLEDFENQYV